ncbi:MAG: two-component sensor histidine kinase [Ignavibacteria bacterium RBG_13_36_8]|nr:MAG: two-component sensor histidine kinase [Ignavibacteria bacterium RBG_13_36_8]
MNKRNSLYYYILVFILAQVAWLGLLGLWIYWYVSNYLIFEQVGEKLSPQINLDSPNLFIFIGGIILIAAVAFGISFIFRNLSVQLKLTRLYDNFISNVTHELKSPLASIQLYLETLSARRVSDSDRKKFLELMLKDTGRLNSLINSILEIPKSEQKKVAHDYHVYDADAIINTLLRETAEQFQLTGKAFKIEGKALCRCVVDPKALKIVFDNLVDNAIKYSGKTINITVKINSGLKKLLIDFCDKGIGINHNDQKKIFKKFQRVYRKDIPNVKGTGLGLYWVREIINSHGGKISVISEGKDKGTTFKIELPIYQVSKKHYINYLLKLTRKREKEREVIDE